MKRTVLIVMAVLAVTLGVSGLSWALSGANGPHTDYRTGYGTGCSGNAACHTLTKVTDRFIPETLGQSPDGNFTDFCLSCHNATGEAHDKSAGSASRNGYVNLTGIDKSAAGSGDSHSWNGKTGNAGTRLPQLPGFKNGTTYMPGNTVACQTCHNGPKKTVGEDFSNWSTARSTNNLNYTFKWTSRRQYLGQYLRVYRSATPVTEPANTRTKKTYLVSPSEYTYRNNTIIFSQSQAGKSIYAEVGEPYFRQSNQSNAICLDCHNDRLDVLVSHEPGTGTKDHHPVGVDFGNANGRTATIKPSASGNVYLEGSTKQVLCTSCHDPHNAPGKDGMLMREPDGSTLCADCHKTVFGGYSTTGQDAVNLHDGAKHGGNPTGCLDCHTTHGSRNIMLIKNVINGKSVNFRSFSGLNSFGGDTGSSVCEACHTATNYHKADGTGTGHNTSKNCLQCHPHAKGFAPSGSCTDCHGDPPSPTKPGPSGWADATGDEHSMHMDHLADSQFGINLTGHDACAQCHGATIPRTNHNSGKDSAGIDTSTWGSWRGNNYGTISFSDGGTIGKTNTADDSCTNVSCHGGAGTRNWALASDCDSCHSYPGSPTNDWAAGNGHAIRNDGVAGHMPATGYNKSTDTYAGMTADETRCGKCHPNTLSNHRNGVVNLRSTGPGDGACGGPFVITVNLSRSDASCSNVRCHADHTTPNWW